MDEVEPSTSGIAVRDFRWALGRLVGEESVVAALASVSRSSRDLFVDAATHAWVPTSAINEVIDAVERQTGMHADEIVTRAARMSTERTLSTVWRVLLRITTDQAIIARTPLLWQRTRNIGSLAVTSHGEGVAVLELTGWPSMARRSALILSVNIETVLRCAGRQDVEVAWARTDSGARYHVSWRA